MESYKQAKNQSGDGKLPNKYFVFQYDTKFKREKVGDCPINEAKETKDNFIGAYKTYQEALNAVNNAYEPYVVIEDRISGVIYEKKCIVCLCCGKEEWENFEDIGFTKKTLGEKFE